MRRGKWTRQWSWVLVLCCGTGCGTTRWSDTARTATEQLLISTAIDRAVNRLDLGVLADKRVYFDTQYLQGVVDERYVTSALRQHLLACGCTLCETRDDADYVLEARSGGIGTDRNELFFGTPSVPVPTGLVGVPVGVASLPAVTVGKNTKQRAVAKLAVYAYNRHTGRPLWQSGAEPVFCNVQDSWLLGAGPFRRGPLHLFRKRQPDELPVDVRSGATTEVALADGGIDSTVERHFEDALPLNDVGTATEAERVASAADERSGTAGVAAEGQRDSAVQPASLRHARPREAVDVITPAGGGKRTGGSTSPTRPAAAAAGASVQTVDGMYQPPAQPAGGLGF